MIVLNTGRGAGPAVSGGARRGFTSPVLPRALTLLLAVLVTVPLGAAARTDDLQARFSWPLSPYPTVVTPFARPASDYGPGHRGVDLAAEPGQQVQAAGSGVVVFAGVVAGRGVLSIDHGGELRTTYEPVSAMVTVGAQVRRGQPIAVVEAGHAGCPRAACLHWGVRRGEEYLNPLALIRTESVIRLKPWDGAGS